MITIETFEPENITLYKWFYYVLRTRRNEACFYVDYGEKNCKGLMLISVCEYKTPSSIELIYTLRKKVICFLILHLNYLNIQLV